MRFGSLVNVLVVITPTLYIVTLTCIYTNSEQSDCMLGAILVPFYKHHKCQLINCPVRTNNIDCCPLKPFAPPLP